MPQLTPDEAFRLAAQHHFAGQLQHAEALYWKILKTVPNHADTLHMLGVLAYQCGRADSAVELIGKAVSFNPNIRGAWNNLGEAQRTLGRFDDAVQSYQRALALEPTSPEALNNLGLALSSLGRLDEAQAAFEKALATRPKFAQCRSNYGNLLGSRGRSEDAIVEYRRAIADMPNYAPAHNNLASALENQDNLADAEAGYRKAVELESNFTEAWNNLGSVIRRTARFDEALACFERALSIDANHPGAGWNAGLVYLTRGDYARGWEGYERRWFVPALPRPRGFTQPQWDGSPLNGRSLLVHCEQGFGDCIQAARYLPLLSRRRGNPGGRIVVEVQHELIDLFRDIDGIDEVIEFGSALPAFDVFVPIFTLPRVFGTRIDTIPANVPYLRADAARIAHFAERVRRARGTKVGLIWAGKTVPDPLRSVPPQALLPLARITDATFVSLQVGESSVASLPDELRAKAIDLGPELKTFADTAAAMANLDLVLTIDTAAAHLAGALGRPTWTLLPFSPDWRWMTERADCPWYPSMRLFRQSKRGDWTSAITTMADELKKFAAT